MTNVFTLMTVSSCFRKPFTSKRVHVSQTLLQPALKQFNPNFPLIRDKWSRKTSPLVRSAILGLFGNMLTVHHIYSCHRLEKLLEQVETLLSEKRRTFSEIDIAFSESIQNFAHFEKKDQLHSSNISEVSDSDICGDFNGPKLLF